MSDVAWIKWKKGSVWLKIEKGEGLEESLKLSSNNVWTYKCLKLHSFLMASTNIQVVIDVWIVLQ